MVPPCFCEPIITPKPNQVTTPSVTSAFFIDKKLGIFAVFLIGADEDEVHIGDDAKATTSAEFTFQLITKIGGVIIEEFDGVAIWQAVFQIDVGAHQRIQRRYLRHPFYL